MEQNRASIGENGKLIRKTLFKMYPGAAIYGLLFNVMLIIDSVIAGSNLGPDGVAAVAIGIPAYGVLLALINALIHGTSLRMVWTKGSADQEGFHRVFCGGFTFIAITGLCFSILLIVLAEPLITLCGGDMTEKHIAESAMLYLRCCAPITFISVLGNVLQETLNVLGFQSTRASLNGVYITVNIIVSVLATSLLPEGMKLAGLGIGTTAAGVVNFIAAIIMMKVHGVSLHYRPVIFKLSEIAETIKCGVPSSVDYIFECTVLGFQNNLILAGFPGDHMILPTAEVVSNIIYFAAGLIKGISYAAAPLFGVFYAERDKNAMKRSLKESFKIGLVMSVVWAFVIYFALPALSALHGMDMSEDIVRGTILCLIFAPFVHTVSLFTMYYESTKRFALSIVFAIVPDSVLYVLIMATMIPVLGKDGIWLAMNGNQLLGLLIMIPVVLIISARTKQKGTDRILLLPKEHYERSLPFSYEINNTRENAVGVSKEVEDYLLSENKSSRISYFMALCTEELAADMLEAAKKGAASDDMNSLLHISLFDDGDSIELVIRTMGTPYNPLDFEPDKDTFSKMGVSMVQRIAKEVTYTNVYKLNVVTITVEA